MLIDIVTGLKWQNKYYDIGNMISAGRYQKCEPGYRISGTLS